MTGFVLCKKVPGSMHFLAKAPGHSFDHMTMNMSHLVHHLYFGTKPTPRRQRALEALHPLGLTEDWADKLRGTSYMSTTGRATFEHYMQVGGVWGVRACHGRGCDCLLPVVSTWGTGCVVVEHSAW